MSFDDLDDDATRPSRATAGAVFRYMVARWRTRPGLLAAFLVFYIGSVADRKSVV